MKPLFVASALCVGLSASAWAQPQHAPGAIADAGTMIVAQNTPVPEGTTGGRSGTPNQEQYKAKKKKAAAAPAPKKSQ